MKSVVLILAGLIAIATFIPLIRYDDWWVRVFDFPRMQIFALGLLVLLVLLFFWNATTWVETAVLTVLIAALAIQAYWILPYTPLSSTEVVDASSSPPDATLTLLVANVMMSNRRADRLLDLIQTEAPDLVLTLEPDDWWERQVRVLEDDYPHTVKAPLDNRYGMLLHSRRELIDPEVKYLVNEEIPSMHVQVRLASGQHVWLHGLHPKPPSPTEAKKSTQRDAELLIVGKEIKDREIPTIVAGDFNDVAWSHTTTLFQKISGLLDPRKGRGLFNTFHANYPPIRWPLDHVFHSDHFTLGTMKRLPAFGSDHFPIYVRLVLQPGAEAVQDETEADREDKKEAEEQIDKVCE